MFFMAAAAGSLPLNRWTVAGPIPLEQWDEAAADRFLAGPLDAVCGVAVSDYVNPRDPETDGLFFIEYFKDTPIPADGAMAYAAVDVEFDEPCGYLMKLNTDDTAAVFVNGVQAFKAEGESFDNLFIVKFHKGLNRIAVKSWHKTGFWAVVLTAMDGPLTDEQCAQAESLKQRIDRVMSMSRNVPLIDGLFVGTVGAKPEPVWSDPAAAKAVFGDNPVRFTWFDERMNPADDFTRPGLYYALVEADTADGAPYKSLFSYYLLKSGWRDDPEIIKFAAAFQWKTPFNVFASTWSAGPQRLKEYLENGDRELKWNRKPRLSSFVADWRQKNYPADLVTLAPPEELETPAPVVRFGSEAEAGFIPGSREKFAALCREWFEKTDNAFYCMIARNGAVVYSEGFGEVQGEKITPVTACGMASMSKLFTGLLFARFLDQGLMDLDEDMSRFMPALAAVPEWKLTPRRCFNHTGGFSGHGNFGGIRNVMGDFEVAYWLPAARPGTECSYNGVGPNLMGMYMMNATATPIDRLFEDNYYRQLGITTMSGDDQGGGYAAGAADLAKLAQLLLNKGSYGKWRFFSPETYEKLMPRDIRGDNPDIRMTTTWFFGRYGVGIHPFRAPSDDPEAVQYYGHGSATFTVFGFDPKYQTFIVQARDDNAKPELNEEYRKKLEDLVWASIEK